MVYIYELVDGQVEDRTMNPENQPLVTDEPVEFEK